MASRSRPNLPRRVSTAARWPVGVSLTSWRYIWRTSPMHRHECAGGRADALAPPFPAGFDTADVQAPSDGVGPLFHRRYVVRIRDARLSPEALMARIREDLNAFAPTEMARFQAVTGDGPLSAGDEYLIRMPGPWDGPVRVVEVTESSFRLATLAGHLEAGQIELRAARDGEPRADGDCEPRTDGDGEPRTAPDGPPRAARDGELVLTIESWARSADRLSDLLYSRMRMAKEVQVHMWVSFLERAVEISGGRRSGCIEVQTRRVDEPARA